MTEPRPRTILVVEDDEDDLIALRWCLRRAQVAHTLQVATDGQRAIDFLADTGADTRPVRVDRPDVVLLDLKLPYKTGLEVLAWARSHREFDTIPIIILSGSDEERDHRQAMALGAQEYWVKPASVEQLVALLDPANPIWRFRYH